MPHYRFYILFFVALGILCSCTQRPSKVELMRREKAQKDSLTYVQAKQNIQYSDSLLQFMIQQVDPLMQSFVYSKNDKAEDHGHYVHRLLQTTSNASRNFVQAYLSDDRKVSVQSYYYGTQPLHQRALRLSVGDSYVEKEGSNHAFQSEGWHEILTIQGEDALQLLAMIANHADECINVRSIGQQTVNYTLSAQQKQALSDTYQLGVLMRDINALERSMHVSNLQIEKYEKKQLNCK